MGSDSSFGDNVEPMIIPIEIWSDIACPWCFVGKANLDTAIRELTDEVPELQFSIRWRAFELDPRPREPSTQNYVERLAAKYQRSVEEAQQMIDNMTAAISDAGGNADFGKVIAANTFDAHRLIQWVGETDRASEAGDAQHQLTDAFMRGYLGDGINLGREEDLLGVVESVGLDQSAAQEVLASKQFADVVREDEQMAEQQGIRGVPFFVIGGYGLSGAQPSSTLAAAMQQARSGLGE
jgi:predicted DsbA family dithiol-disulfide isomerase